MVRLKIMGLFPSIHMDPYYPGCLGPLLNFKWSNTKTGKTQFSRFLWRFLVLVGRYNHIINEEGLRHLSEPRKSKDMHMGGSINGGTTKSAIFNRIFSINHPAIGATPIYGNPQIDIYIYIYIYMGTSHATYFRQVMQMAPGVPPLVNIFVFVASVPTISDNFYHITFLKRIYCVLDGTI